MFAVIAVVFVAFLYIVQLIVVGEQQRGLRGMAHDLARAAEQNGGRLPDGMLSIRSLDPLVHKHGLSEWPMLFVIGDDGRLLQQFPSDPPVDPERIRPLLAEAATGSAHLAEFGMPASDDVYAIAVEPIVAPASSRVSGHVLYVERKADALDELLQFRPMRLAAILTLLLAGWAITFMLTRRLAKPIQEAANAAKQVVAGNYEIRLDQEPKEQEVYELIHSFKSMAERLRQLESLRTQLLAGVTHELKTPVASISGLLQAVRDGVVSGQEADAFLRVCQQESDRLQKMIEDLLDFNRFAAGAVSVVFQRVDLRAAVPEMVERWRMGQEKCAVSVVFEAGEEEGRREELEPAWQVMTDPARLGQILINLLNNARDAKDGGAAIAVRCRREAGGIAIRVEDHGRGIPADEQPDVFEPFFRGVGKKSRIRGLGIGLPFSRLIARSLGGDLILENSAPGSTVFLLRLPS